MFLTLGSESQRDIGIHSTPQIIKLNTSCKKSICLMAKYVKLQDSFNNKTSLCPMTTAKRQAFKMFFFPQCPDLVCPAIHCRCHIKTPCIFISLELSTDYEGVPDLFAIWKGSPGPKKFKNLWYIVCTYVYYIYKFVCVLSHVFIMHVDDVTNGPQGLKNLSLPFWDFKMA